jgi:hypothetical protein
MNYGHALDNTPAPYETPANKKASAPACAAARARRSCCAYTLEGTGRGGALPTAFASATDPAPRVLLPGRALVLSGAHAKFDAHARPACSSSLTYLCGVHRSPKPRRRNLVLLAAVTSDMYTLASGADNKEPEHSEVVIYVAVGTPTTGYSRSPTIAPFRARERCARLSCRAALGGWPLGGCVGGCSSTQRGRDRRHAKAV